MPSSTNGGIKQRIYMHYKSLKGHIEWVKDSDCDGCDYNFPHWTTPHMHGHNVITTPNHIWLLLARTHKMKVREVKNIINEKRSSL